MSYYTDGIPQGLVDLGLGLAIPGLGPAIAAGRASKKLLKKLPAKKQLAKQPSMLDKIKHELGQFNPHSISTDPSIWTKTIPQVWKKLQESPSRNIAPTGISAEQIERMNRETPRITPFMYPIQY